MSLEEKPIYSYIDIKISGSAGAILKEVELIEKTFKDLGYKVNLTSNHPEMHVKNNSSYVLTKEDMELIAECEKQALETTIINLDVKHLPWGG